MVSNKFRWWGHAACTQEALVFFNTIAWHVIENALHLVIKGHLNSDCFLCPKPMGCVMGLQIVCPLIFGVHFRKWNTNIQQTFLRTTACVLPIVSFVNYVWGASQIISKKNWNSEVLTSPLAPWNRSWHFQNIMIDIFSLAQLNRLFNFEQKLCDKVWWAIGNFETCWKFIKNMVWTHWELNVNTWLIIVGSLGGKTLWRSKSRKSSKLPFHSKRRKTWAS
jgi:hypothetical protein